MSHFHSADLTEESRVALVHVPFLRGHARSSEQLGAKHSNARRPSLLASLHSGVR
jgi:hypothetical protein